MSTTDAAVKPTVRVIPWPDSGGQWWVVEHREGRGFTPVLSFGDKRQDRLNAEWYGRGYAFAKGYDFEEAA